MKIRKYRLYNENEKESKEKAYYYTNTKMGKKFVERNKKE